LLFEGMPPDSECKRLVSEVQCDALLQVLRPRKDWDPLSDEHRALLVEMTCASGFHDDDQARTLKAIAGIKSAPSRRNQQDATHHASYISGPEWEGIGQFTAPEVGKATPDLIYAQAILDILVCRMGVVNPSEPTLKAVTSNALVLAHGSRIGLLTYEDKMALLSWIRKKLKAMVRVQKSHKVTPIPYCEMFPPNPCDLEAIHPKLYSKLKIPGCWTDSRVNTQLYTRALCTFSCRRNPNSMHNLVPAVQGFDVNKLMFGMMQKMLQQNADDDEDGIFTYNMPGRRKRSIDGLEQRLSLKRRRSSFGFGMDDEEEEHEEPPRGEAPAAKAVGKAASVGKAPPVGRGPRIEEVPEFGEPPAEEDEEPAVEEASAEEVEVSAVPALAIVKAAVAQVPVVAKAQEQSPFGLPKAREPSADELLDAIIQRDAERAEAAKVAAAAKRAAAAAAKKEAAQLEKAEAAKAAEAAKEAAPADGEAKLPVKAGAKPPAVAKPSAVGKPRGKRPAVGKAVGMPPAIGKPPAVAKPSAVGVGKPPAVAKPSAVGVGMPPAVAKHQPPAVAKPPAVGKASAVGKAKPTWSHEGSRTQYLCRTGVKGPGQSHAIKYGDGIMTKEGARLEAVRWVAEKEKS